MTLSFVRTFPKACVLVGVFALVVAGGSLAERAIGSPLRETVTVSSRQISPTYTAYADRDVISHPGKCVLYVGNNSGHSSVEVPVELFDRVREGDTVIVEGARGAVTGNWYLQSAEPLSSLSGSR